MVSIQDVKLYVTLGRRDVDKFFELRELKYPLDKVEGREIICQFTTDSHPLGLRNFEELLHSFITVFGIAELFAFREKRL